MWFVQLQAVTFSMSLCPHASPPSTPCYHSTWPSSLCQQCSPHDLAENSRVAVFWPALTPTHFMHGRVVGSSTEMWKNVFCDWSVWILPLYAQVLLLLDQSSNVVQDFSNGSIVKDSHWTEAPSHEKTLTLLWLMDYDFNLTFCFRLPKSFAFMFWRVFVYDNLIVLYGFFFPCILEEMDQNLMPWKNGKFSCCSTCVVSPFFLVRQSNVVIVHMLSSG